MATGGGFWVAAGDQAAEFFRKILNFDANQSNPAGMRDSLINQVRDNYDTHFQVVAPYIAYAIRKGTDFEALEREARNTVEEVKKAASDLKTQSDDLLAQLNSVLKTVRAAAAEVGVAQHATNFRDQAAEHLKDGAVWRNTIIGLSILGLLTIGALFVWPLHPDIALATTAQAVYAVGSRLLVFSIIYFAILWSARNYMAQRHNYVVNKHRQNALTTFETFVKAAGDDQDVKNSVLLQASQSIFGPQASGYLSKEPITPPPGNLVEIVRAATSPSRDG